MEGRSPGSGSFLWLMGTLLLLLRKGCTILWRSSRDRCWRGTIAIANRCDSSEPLLVESVELEAESRYLEAGGREISYLWIESIHCRFPAYHLVSFDKSFALGCVSWLRH